MIFRVFAHEELENLYNILAVNHVAGPVKRAETLKTGPSYDFDFIYDYDELNLDYPSTVHSLKHFLLPARETLSTFTLHRNGTWRKDVDLNAYKPTVYFGVHACDINALNKLDKVLTGSVYPDPYYTAKRKNMFIVGVSCDPQPYCFCRSMGADTALHGFDLFLTNLGHLWFAEILSARAYECVSAIESREPEEKEHNHYQRITEERSEAFTCHVDTTDLTKILDMEFESEAWLEWGRKCLSCGTCAQVCPTCYCYDVKEYVDLDLQGASKVKQLYSCNLIDFAKVAGGFNFRPESHRRLKYRYYHKHRGFVESFEEPLCVGCGRCGESCLAGIAPPEVIASIRGQEESHG